MSIDFGTRRAASPAVERDTAERSSVAWATVLSLGLALAYADGAWAQILRGATGAIQRTQTPFASWLKESTAVAPLFVAAVLGAFALSARWFGPRNRSARALLATGLLVTAAGTLTALALAAISAGYDYHLQSLHGHANGLASAAEQHATVALHARGLLYVGRWMLVTNLVLVAWLIAMWGGRLRLVAEQASRTGATRATSSTTRLALVAALAGSAAIHAAVVQHHFGEWPAAGLFFILLTVWELGVAGLLLARVADRLILLAAVALSAGPLALWLTSRATGLPFGPEAGTAEALGLPDAIASTLELVSLLTAVVLLRRGNTTRSTAATNANLRAMVLVGVVALTAVALAGVGLSWFDPFGVGPIQSTVHSSH